MEPSDSEPDDDPEDKRLRARDVAEGVGFVGDVVDTGFTVARVGRGAANIARSVFHSGCDGCDGCHGCDVPDCGCDLPLLFRLSTLLLAVAGVLPAGGSGRLLRASIRGYRRWLTRFTPACPSSPSCSTYALAAVAALGPRHGLAAAAHRIDRCGRPRA